MDKTISKTLECGVDIQTFSILKPLTTDITNCYQWYKDYYFPQTIYTQPSIDKVKSAYEIIKILRDEKLINIKTVKNFTDIMDKIINIL